MAKRKISKLQQLMKHKEVRIEIGEIELKEKLAKAIELFIKNDPKLFALILTEALENYQIYTLAQEFEEELKKGKES